MVFLKRRLGLLVVIEYLITDINAFVANIHARTGNELAHIVLRFTANEQQRSSSGRRNWAYFDFRFGIAECGLM